MSSQRPHGFRDSSLQLAGDNRSPEIPTPRWHQVKNIQGLNWNRSYPYQLLVVREEAPDNYVSLPEWSFTLPIPPEALSITMNPGVDGRATVGGYVEQHSGVRTNEIQISGTTGVLPLRGSVGRRREFTAAETIFAGTIRAGQQINEAFEQVSQDLSPRRTPANLIRPEDVTGDTELGRTSGYYQFRLLQQFLERYAAVKATDRGRDLRIALACWKDEAIYLFTPGPFRLSRQVPRVYEYPYSWSMRGFRRITLGAPPPFDASLAPAAQTPDGLSRALRALDDSRRVLAGSRQALRGILGDVSNLILEPLRSVTLLVKDLAGTSLAMADLSREAVRSCRDAILELASVRDTYEALPAGFDSVRDRASSEWEVLRRAAADLTGKSLDALDAVLADPEAHYEFLSSIKLSSIRPSARATDLIARERERVSKLGWSDFVEYGRVVRRVSDVFADSVGLGDPDYDSTFRRTARTPTRTATSADYETVFSLNEVATQLDQLTATTAVRRRVLASEVVGDAARAAGFRFERPAGKFSVPLPYGWSLQRLAQRYLGDPQRWHEIAALNGLREPYVDEEGYDLPLLVDAVGVRICVVVSRDLAAGSRVVLRSVGRPDLAAKVVRVDPVASGYQVELDRDATGYVVSDGAALKVFRTGTVNSSIPVWIPSQTAPREDDVDWRRPTGVDETDPLVRQFGVEPLLDESNDLVVTDSGDTPWATGYTAAIQQVRCVTSVRRGTLPRHDGVGIDYGVGETTADLTVEDLAEQASKILEGDASFAGVESVAVERKGGTTNVGLTIKVAGSSRVLPVWLEG